MASAVPAVPMPAAVPADLKVIAADFALTATSSTFPAKLERMGDSIGKVHTMWSTTVKVTCGKHTDCALLLRHAWCGGGRFKAARVGIEWVSKAADVNQIEHWNQAVAIRTSLQASWANGTSSASV